jgi:hypothetical protein
VARLNWFLQILFGPTANFFLGLAHLVDISDFRALIFGMAQLGAFVVLSSVNLHGIRANQHAGRLLEIAESHTALA